MFSGICGRTQVSRIFQALPDALSSGIYLTGLPNTKANESMNGRKFLVSSTHPKLFTSTYSLKNTLAGPMIKLSVFGKTAIFLGNGKSISELFAKRSSEFSDRPVLTFAGELYVQDAVT